MKVRNQLLRFNVKNKQKALRRLILQSGQQSRCILHKMEFLNDTISDEFCGHPNPFLVSIIRKQRR
ncbi:CLUMA_CG003619, isoform A [Clunio marinus]|uniref:CLUMA_CG003619, isoform A n=1 Tax=Clunio marinus TaxID=568069 RepID=A0A1J1HQK0_9DIPT|nr:CLUMA_CG003619, isoform A [Clunio marinus]